LLALFFTGYIYTLFYRAGQFCPRNEVISFSQKGFCALGLGLELALELR